MIRIPAKVLRELVSEVKDLESLIVSDWHNAHRTPLFRARRLREDLTKLLAQEEPGIERCYHCDKPILAGTYHVQKLECEVIERKPAD